MGTAPEWRITEIDQTDPAGRFRLRSTGNGLILERITTANWAADADLLVVDVGNKAITLGQNADDWYLDIGEGLLGSGAWILLGDTGSGSPGVEVRTGNAAGSRVARLLIDTNVTIATVDITADAYFRLLGSQIGRVNFDPSALSGTPSTTGAWYDEAAATFTDNVTAGSGTVAAMAFNALQQPTFSSSIGGAGTEVTCTDAATLYIAAAPAAVANKTIITNAWALWVDSGGVRLDGNLQLGTSTISSTGTLTINAFTLGGTLTAAAQQISLSTGNITFSGNGYISIGATPGDAGGLRFPNNNTTSGMIAWRNSGGTGNVVLYVDNNDRYLFGQSLNMQNNTIFGDAGVAGGALTLRGTAHATVGYVLIPAADIGLKVGGTAAHATTPGTNIVSVFNGTAPVGALANGISLYSAAGEAYFIDAGGVASIQSPHDPKTGEWVFYSKHTLTGRVVKVRMEAFVREVCNRMGLDFFKEYLEEPGNIIPL